MHPIKDLGGAAKAHASAPQPNERAMLVLYVNHIYVCR